MIRRWRWNNLHNKLDNNLNRKFIILVFTSGRRTVCNNGGRLFKSLLLEYCPVISDICTQSPNGFLLKNQDHSQKLLVLVDYFDFSETTDDCLWASWSFQWILILISLYIAVNRRQENYRAPLRKSLENEWCIVIRKTMLFFPAALKCIKEDI